MGVFLLVVVAAAGVPLLSVQTPALGDYLNHLARVHIISAIDQDPHLAQFFTITWHLIPNLAMDLLVPVLDRYLDVYVAG